MGEAHVKHTFQISLTNEHSIMHAKRLIESAFKVDAISEGSHAEIYAGADFSPAGMWFEVSFITYHNSTMNAIKAFLNENGDLYEQWYYKSEIVEI